MFYISLILLLMIMLLFLPAEQLKHFILLVKSSHGQRKVSSTIYLKYCKCVVISRIIILLLVYVNMLKRTVKVLRVLMKKL